MIAVGAWLEVQERTITAAIESEEFLAGPYLIIGAGCAIVLVAIIGIVGAMCDKKINRFLLYFVSNCIQAVLTFALSPLPSPPAVHRAGADHICSTVGWWDLGLCVQRPVDHHCGRRTHCHFGEVWGEHLHQHCQSSSHRVLGFCPRKCKT